MTTITIDRALLEQAIEAHSALRDWIKAVPTDTQLPAMPGIDGDWLDMVETRIRAALVAPATAPAQPAWHDAPTCEGMWLCDEGDENPYRFTCHDISMPLNPYLVGEGERWFGPIPEDKP